MDEKRTTQESSQKHVTANLNNLENISSINQSERMSSSCKWSLLLLVILIISVCTIAIVVSVAIPNNNSLSNSDGTTRSPSNSSTTVTAANASSSTSVSITTTTTTTTSNTCNSSWSQTGIIVAGNGAQGSGINQLNYPNTLFIDRLNNIYIPDTNNHRIMKYPSGGGSPVVVAGVTGIAGSNSSLLRRPFVVHVDANQNMFVGDTNNFRVQYFSVGSTVGIRVAGTGIAGNTSSTFMDVWGLYLDTTNQRLYLADYNTNRVIIWNSIGSNISLSSMNVNSALDVEIDSSTGTLYVYSLNLGVVLAYPAGSSVGMVVASGFVGPSTIRLDGRGNLFVSSFYYGVIKMFCLGNGNTAGVTVVSGLSAVSDVAFDSNFNLYALEVGIQSVRMYHKL